MNDDVTAQSPVAAPGHVSREDLHVAMQHGTVVLLGGGEVGDDVLAREILGSTPGARVAVIPTASAFEGPEAVVVAIAEWLVGHGAEIEGLMVSSRAEADLADMADRLEDASIGYLSDGTALHLRTTLKSTALFDALMAMLEKGKTVVASGASATVLCDPMIDPRGGAPTVGLGPIRAFTVVPHVGGDEDDPREEKLHRTIELASAKVPVVALPMGAGLRLASDGSVQAFGRGAINVYVDGALIPAGVSSLGAWWGED